MEDELYCTVCHGRGLTEDDTLCPHCHGTGYEPTDMALDIYEEMVLAELNIE